VTRFNFFLCCLAFVATHELITTQQTTSVIVLYIFKNK